MTKPDGGPAFPCESISRYPGMSLRDYFAGQALAGLLARSSSDVPHCLTCCPVSEDAGEHYADISYRYADALRAWRDKP